MLPWFISRTSPRLLTLPYYSKLCSGTWFSNHYSLCAQPSTWSLVGTLNCHEVWFIHRRSVIAQAFRKSKSDLHQTPTETGWDFRLFAAVPVPGKTSPPQNTNYQGLKITVRMHSWGKFMKKNYNLPTKKTQASLLRYLEQKQGTAHSVRTTTKTVGKPPKPPLHLIPTLSLYKEGACPAQRASKGTGCLFLPPPAAIRAPMKPCLNFLSGLFINFCWLRKASLVA